MDTDFRFACAECDFGCANDGWNKLKKEFVKTLQKNFYLSY